MVEDALGQGGVAGQFLDPGTAELAMVAAMGLRTDFIWMDGTMTPWDQANVHAFFGRHH